jgi:hypothetical protein
MKTTMTAARSTDLAPRELQTDVVQTTAITATIMIAELHGLT